MTDSPVTSAVTTDRTETDRLEIVRQRRMSLRSWMGAVEAALAVPAAGRIATWRQGVLGALYGLEQCMRDHVDATEGPDGFHAEVVTAAPRLANASERLVVEHQHIDAQIATLLTQAADATTEEDVDAVRAAGNVLVALLSQHRQRGADLIFEAYQADLGGAD